MKEKYLNSKAIEKRFNNNLLNHALHYAKLGLPVLPLHNPVRFGSSFICSCRDGRFCKDSCKHPRTRNGFYNATTNELIIIEWWEMYPDANIGILTGRESGFIVLDVDIKDGGNHSLSYLENEYRDLLGQDSEDYDSVSGTLAAYSGSGGSHYYFNYPKDYEVKGSVSKIGLGLDVRANGNYIIAPPSRNILGNQYQWFGTNTDIMDAPTWLIYETQKEQPNYSKQVIKTDAKAKKTKIRDGEGRYDFFWRYVAGLVNSFSHEMALKLAMAKNEELLVPPYDDKRVEYIVSYLYRRYGN